MTTATPKTNLLEAHEQWRDRPADQRFESLELLKAAVDSRRARSRSTDLEIGKLHIEDQGETLIVNGAVSPCEPSHWAFSQLATTIKAPAGYLRNLPRPLLVENIRHGLASAEAESVKFMTVTSEDDKPNVLQAVTSPTYGRIWDADVIDSISRIVERTGGRFQNPLEHGGKRGGLYASDHDCFALMVDGGSRLDAGPRAQLNRGFIVGNSETGARAFWMMTFLFNEVCGNHIIWGASEINKLIIRHTSGGPGRFDAQAAPMLKAYAEAPAAPLEVVIRKAQDVLLPVFKTSDDLMPFASTAAKFSRSELREAVAFAKSEEGECRSVWQLVQGFTAYARGIEHADSRLDLEVRAGKFLDALAEK